VKQGHTPGPWAVFHDHPDPATAATLALIRPANSAGYDEHDDIASIYVTELPERAANAQLIAAAPDLLEALQAFMALDRTFSTTCEQGLAELAAQSGRHGELPRAVQKARAAIARATGAAS
jgi:hypothetical protein